MGQRLQPLQHHQHDHLHALWEFLGEQPAKCGGIFSWGDFLYGRSDLRGVLDAGTAIRKGLK